MGFARVEQATRMEFLAFIWLASIAIVTGTHPSQLKHGKQRHSDSVPLTVEDWRQIGDLVVGLNSYQNANRLAGMVAAVSTRFKLVLVKYDNSINDTLSAIVDHNNNANCALRNKNNATHAPLEHVYIELGAGNYDNNYIQRFFNVVADFKRSIGAQTITTLVVPVEFLRKQSISSMEDTGSKIGVKVGFDVCNRKTSLKRTRKLQKVQLLLVSISWNETFHIVGSEESSAVITTMIKSCALKLQRFLPSGRVGFSVTWPDTNFLGTKRNQSELVNFWKEMAAVSLAINVTLFMENVVDLNRPEARHIDNSNGWWTNKLKEKALKPRNKLLIPKFSKLEPLVCGVNETKTPEYNFIHSKNCDKKSCAAFLTSTTFGRPLFFNEWFLYLSTISESISKLIVPADMLFQQSRHVQDRNIWAIKAVSIWNRYVTRCHVKKSRFSISIHTTIDTTDMSLQQEKIMFINTLLCTAESIAAGTKFGIAMALNEQEQISRLSWSILSKLLIQYTDKGGSIAWIESGHRLDDEYFLNQWTKNIYPHVDMLYLRYDVCFKLTLGMTYEEALREVMAQIHASHKRISSTFQVEFQKTSVKIGISVSSDMCNVKLNYSQSANISLVLNDYCGEENLTILLDHIDIVQKDDDSVWLSTVTVSPQKISSSKMLSNNSSSETNSSVIALLAVPLTAYASLVVLFSFVWIAAKKKQQKILAKEAETFRNETCIAGYSHNKDLVSSRVCLNYNVDLEIKREDFVIEYGKPLGLGAFGIVTLAKIVKNQRSIWVAAKTVHCSGTRDISGLRSLLMEIKLLSYLSAHPNVAQLMGASTAEINTSGKVYAFYELCHLGSLLNFVRNKSKPKSCTEQQGSEYISLSEPEIEWEELLVKWSLEIATGMDFISSKFIVHADLAARNVLLDKCKTAKICDFGLSRRIENHEIYKKGKSENLPWRWMAPESLTALEFSSKSDVWSYGVTLWEIHSKGDIPYLGRGWSSDFATKLMEGVRLLKPKEADSEMYYNLMKSCWESLPDQRPSFSQIKNKLTKVYTQFHGKCTDYTSAFEVLPTEEE